MLPSGKAEIVDNLRERLLSPHPLDDWYAEVRGTWDDFDHALPDGETSRAAPERGTRALAELAGRHPRETIVAASHGNLIALILNARDDSAGFESWDAMPMPALYELEIGSASRIPDRETLATGPAVSPLFHRHRPPQT